MTYREPTFEALARAIVYQQLSTKAASTILGRFQAAAGGALSPESIQQLTVPEMRQAGLSKQKIGYIRDLAEHAISGKVNFARLPDMSDEEVIVALTDIKGIGVWTAHMFLSSTRNANCHWPKTLKSWRRAGIHTAAWLPGTYGAVWS